LNFKISGALFNSKSKIIQKLISKIENNQYRVLPINIRLNVFSG